MSKNNRELAAWLLRLFRIDAFMERYQTLRTGLSRLLKTQAEACVFYFDKNLSCGVPSIFGVEGNAEVHKHMSEAHKLIATSNNVSKDFRRMGTK